jgi:uncharacterized membrane protein YkoI
MRKRLIAIAAGLAAAGAGAAGVATASDSQTAAEPASAPAAGAASRLDDGKDLLPQAKVSEADAIAAAQGAASGKLNEVDLEHRDGRLVWNVDVGRRDVKVDAATGEVLAADADD